RRRMSSPLRLDDLVCPGPTEGGSRCPLQGDGHGGGRAALLIFTAAREGADHTTDEQLRLCLLQVKEVFEDTRGAGHEHQKEDACLRAADDLAEGGQVDLVLRAREMDRAAGGSCCCSTDLGRSAVFLREAARVTAAGLA